MTATINRPPAGGAGGPGGPDGGAPGGLPPQRSARPSAPAARSWAADDAQTATTIALTLLSLATVVCMRRLFDDWSFLAPVAGTALAVHAAAWAARRYRLPAISAVLAPLAAFALAVAWFQLPDTTFFGVPTSATFHAAVDRLHASLSDFRTVVAPAPVTTGFVLASMLGAGIVAAVADWAACRMKAALEAAVPAFGLFIFVVALASPKGRVASIAVEVGALLTYVLVQQISHQARATGWVANRSQGVGAAMVKAGLAIGAAAVLAAVIVGPNIPGAQGKALLAWRAQSSDGKATRSTVSPFVDIRGRLVESQNLEVFMVSSPVKAYWRLTSLDSFNGNIWSSNESYKEVKTKLPKAGRPAPGPQVQTSFQISALSSIWLPAPYDPVRIDGVSDISYNEDSGSLISSKDTADGLAYTVSSVLPQYTAAVLNGAGPIDPNAAKEARYLKLPDIPAKVRALAQEITKGKATEYDKALALQNYLRTNYSYSTDVRLNHSDSAISEFLFGPVKKGYCEQFAGSYAVMARSIGLPTRIAVGFTSGTVGEDGLYHVHNEQAHAWPEVFFPNIGWAAFEPTPGRAVPNGEAYTGIADTSAVNDAGTDTTDTTIVDTPETVPQEATVPTTVPPDPNIDTTTPKSHHTSPWLVALVVIGLLVLLAGLWILGVPALLRSKRDRRRQAATTSAERVLVAWREADDILRISGHGRRPHETFREHARRAGAEAQLDRDTQTVLVRLAGDATVANYVDDDLPESVAERAAQAAAAVEHAVLARTPKGQKFLRQVDPRPLVTNRR